MVREMLQHDCVIFIIFVVSLLLVFLSFSIAARVIANVVIMTFAVYKTPASTKARGEMHMPRLPTPCMLLLICVRAMLYDILHVSRVCRSRTILM